MTTEYTGTGDPARSMALLWGIQDKPKRGPKPKLTVEQIARAAIELADAEGLEAVSMRRLAERLGGVTAMSLYTYIPGKGELLDLMLDTVLGEMTAPIEGDDWRYRLEQVARQGRDHYLRHPWLLQIAIARPVLGPNLIARYDRDLTAIEGLGLSDIEMDLIITMVGNYVHGAARGAIDAAQAEKHTGMTDDQWWEAHSPLLEKVWDGKSYPVATRVGETAGQEYGAGDPERSFEFGLQRLLDGVSALIAEDPGSKHGKY
ncbi:MAG TPA: TetR family transcriptional regulator [Micromonosporaceae bacterium]|nr:TetR family transcriptional regulator [Micromonosporaceae bacterium]HCU49993.1 TetR family transcriptional regulator [Micromonosporaceae bacterium]